MKRALCIGFVVAALGCGGGSKKGGAAGPDDYEAAGGADPESSEEGFVQPEKYDEISKHFRSKRPQVARCYNEAVETEKIDKKAAGKVTVDLSISPVGKPVNVRVAKTTLNNKVVEECVIETVSSWTLPEPGSSCEFSFTYEFEPE